MSKSKGDGPKKYTRTRYDKENWVIKQLTNRRRRRANKRYADEYGDENKTPNPEKSTGGWLTW